MTPEFSRPVSVARRHDFTPRRIEANEAERAALARRFDLVAIERLAAEVALEPAPRGAVKLVALLDAEVVQTCIVTLEPVPARVTERFEVIFAPEIDEEAELIVDEDAPVVVPLEGESVDLGEAVAQQLSLALDPFPRKPDAALPGEAGEGAASPFAALAAWKRRDV